MWNSSLTNSSPCSFLSSFTLSYSFSIFCRPTILILLSQIHAKINKKLTLYLSLRIVRRNCRQSIQYELTSLFVVGLWVCKLKLKWVCCFVMGLQICLDISLFFFRFASAFVDLRICLGISFGFAFVLSAYGTQVLRTQVATVNSCFLDYRC